MLTFEDYITELRKSGTSPMHFMRVYTASSSMPGAQECSYREDITPYRIFLRYFAWTTTHADRGQPTSEELFEHYMIQCRIAHHYYIVHCNELHEHSKADLKYYETRQPNPTRHEIPPVDKFIITQAHNTASNLMPFILDWFALVDRYRYIHLSFVIRDNLEARQELRRIHAAIAVGSLVVGIIALAVILSVDISPYFALTCLLTLLVAGVAIASQPAIRPLLDVNGYPVVDATPVEHPHQLYQYDQSEEVFFLKEKESRRYNMHVTESNYVKQWPPCIPEYIPSTATVEHIYDKVQHQLITGIADDDWGPTAESTRKTFRLFSREALNLRSDRLYSDKDKYLACDQTQFAPRPKFGN